MHNPLFALFRSFPPPLFSPTLTSPPTSPFWQPPLPSLCTTSSHFSFSCRHPAVPPRRVGSESGALSDAVPAEEEESEFVDVGYICNVHGLKGEVKVKPSTDFPELRFCKPGKRWLRARIMGKEMVQEVQLMGGRSHTGQKIWIVTINGIDTIDKAKQIVGSSILVKVDDRPKLEDGEFYTNDLVGMRVVLKKSSAAVGIVVNVVNFGSTDLLQVMLDSANGSSDIKFPPGSLVWIPFVEAIVPDVDMTQRVMQITPPKGLLELNLRSASGSKKERSQQEWKEKKKFQKHVIAAKKKLIEIGQKHVLQGFSHGEKDKKSMLANQIVDINFKLFRHAVQEINTTCDRIDMSEFLNTDSIQRNSLTLSRECLCTITRNNKEDTHSELLKGGLDLLSEAKVGIVLVVGGDDSSDLEVQVPNSFTEKPVSRLRRLQELLLNEENFIKIDGQRTRLPLIIVTPISEVQFYQELFADHDYFGFDVEKVWFFEEEQLPVVNYTPDDQSVHRILLRSPWEILWSSTGSGGMFGSPSSQHILDNFSKWGVEYVQVCSVAERTAVGQGMLLGLTSSKGMDLGIKVFDESYSEDEFDVIISMKFLAEIVKHEKLKFNMVAVQHEHIKHVDNEWVAIRPTEPNSICFQSSIYNLVNVSNVERICALHIKD